MQVQILVAHVDAVVFTSPLKKFSLTLRPLNNALQTVKLALIVKHSDCVHIKRRKNGSHVFRLFISLEWVLSVLITKHRDFLAVFELNRGSVEGCEACYFLSEARLDAVEAGLGQGE